jgi:hypothetical protein
MLISVVNGQNLQKGLNPADRDNPLATDLKNSKPFQHFRIFSTPNGLKA